VPGSKLNHCGIATAHALARCSFSEKLVNALNVLLDDTFIEYLIQQRNELRAELCTNLFGYMKSKQAKLVNTLPDSFPNLKVLRAYVQPVTSESEALSAGFENRL
jgi:Holliday junction resolvase YEN1